MRTKLWLGGLLAILVSTLLAQEETPSPDDQAAELIKKIEQGVVVIQHEEGMGSGIIISPDGYILTNGHVVSAVVTDRDRDEDDPKAVAKKITVTLFNDQKYPAKVIGLSLDPDVSLIKIETPEPLKPLELGDSSTVRITQKVYAYGAPQGMKRTLTAGIVSNIERTDLHTFTKVIQTDAAINPGNSGGPLLSENGVVLGINTYGGRGQGMGFTLPINVAKVLKEHFLKYGYFKRADFPFFITNSINDDLGQLLGVKKGILIDYVVPDSPAAQAGLKDGDIITELNNQPVSAKNEAELSDFNWQVSTLEIASPIKLKVLRGDKDNQNELIISGVLKEDEPAVEHQYQFGELKELRYDDLGLGVKRMTTLSGVLYNMPNINGVRVVRAEGVTAKAGITRTDLITEIDRQPIKDENQFQSELEKRLAQTQKYILLTAQRGNDVIKTALKPAYEMSGKKIVLVLPEGEAEYLEIVNRFLITNGSKVITLKAGQNTKIDLKDYDGILLLGGANAQTLWNDPQVLSLIQAAVKEKKTIGAVGAASLALVNASPELRTKKLTTDEACSRLMLDKIDKKENYTGKEVEQDGLVITTTGFEKKVVKAFLAEFRRTIKGNE